MRHFSVLYSAMFVVLITKAYLSEENVHYSSCALEHHKPLEMIYDLAGRRRVITKDLQTQKLHVYWVSDHPTTGLPIVEDPDTGLPYLIHYSVTKRDMMLYRLIKGKNALPVVVNVSSLTLFIPVHNKYKEVILQPVTTLEAGITPEEAVLE